MSTFLVLLGGGYMFLMLYCMVGGAPKRLHHSNFISSPPPMFHLMSTSLQDPNKMKIEMIIFPNIAITLNVICNSAAKLQLNLR